MKLLFDQNLSQRLVERLADMFPEATHVSQVRLDRASDEEVWTYARANGFTIVTKDADFSDLSLLRGFPPKVIWVRLGNCTTAQIETVLREQYETIVAFVAEPNVGTLELR